MSSAPPKRGRSKRARPPPLKLSFGSASGACSSLPSTMKTSLSELLTQLQMKRQQAQEEDWCFKDTNGNKTGWTRHRYPSGQDERGHHLDNASGDVTRRSSSHRRDFKLDLPKALENGTGSMGLKGEGKEPPAVVARDVEVLTQADLADIVSRCREFLEERGPSQEEEICGKVLGPHKASLVRTAFGSLASFLAQQPGFHHTLEGDYSFLYFMEPDEEEEGEQGDATNSSSLSPSSASDLFPDDHSEDGPAEAGGVAEEGDGPQSGRDATPCGRSSSSSSLTSYMSALDEWEEERKDACTQTEEHEEEETSPSCGRCQWHSAQEEGKHDGQTQTSCLDTALLVEEEQRLKEKIRLLEAKIASLEDNHNREIRELCLALEELQRRCRCQRPPSPPLTPPLPQEQSASLQVEQGNGEGDAHHGLSPLGKEEEKKGSKGAQLARPDVPEGVLSSGTCPKEEGAEDAGHAGSPSSLIAVGGGAGLTGTSSSTGGAVHTEEGKGKERLPSEEPAAKPIPAEAENKSSGPNAGCPEGEEMVELRWRLEQLRGGTNSDRDSSMVGGAAATRCSSVCSTPTVSKSEAQITKIVNLLRKQLPHCSEADIRAHVNRVRRLRGGFSCMTIRDIVTLVLGHYCKGKKQQQQGQEEQEGER